MSLWRLTVSAAVLSPRRHESHGAEEPEARSRLSLTWKKKCVRNSYPLAIVKDVLVIMRPVGG